MLTARVIPCLDIKDGRTVKGTKFLDLRDAGDPVELAARYSDEGADELVFLDISASRDGRKTLLRLVELVAKAVQIPFTVGGGISSTEDILRTLEAGADKVSLNTSLVTDPELLVSAVEAVGSQSLVAAIDAKRIGNSWRVFIKGGSEPTALDAMEWAKESVRRGAGELLVTSMDADGTAAGYDIPLLRSITQQISVPVIASGGAGNADHCRQAIADGGADAVLVASILHYQQHSIRSIKEYLHVHNIPVRP